MVRALLTSYLLYLLTDDKAYHGFADPEAALPVEGGGPQRRPVDLEDRVVALLKP